MQWFLLSLAIVAEVSATLSLRMATKGSRAWYLPVIAGYALAFTLLAAVLALGMPLGVAYGIWSAAGVAITAVLGAVLFKERFTWVMALGIALIIGGILLVEGAAR